MVLQFAAVGLLGPPLLSCSIRVIDQSFDSVWWGANVSFFFQAWNQNTLKHSSAPEILSPSRSMWCEADRAASLSLPASSSTNLPSLSQHALRGNGQQQYAKHTRAALSRQKHFLRNKNIRNQEQKAKEQQHHVVCFMNFIYNSLCLRLLTTPSTRSGDDGCTLTYEGC